MQSWKEMVKRKRVCPREAWDNVPDEDLENVSNRESLIKVSDINEWVVLRIKELKEERRCLLNKIKREDTATMNGNPNFENTYESDKNKIRKINNKLDLLRELKVE